MEKPDRFLAKVKAKDEYMQLAIDEARIGIYNNDGGPFGSVIIKDGTIIARGHNCVLSNNDSTAHGEIEAIRKAEKNLKTHSLEGAILYTTGEPCPMCLAACLWANIKKVYYGCTIKDNEKIGFRDELFDKLMGGRKNISSLISLEEVDREACLELFKEYSLLESTKY